MSEKLTSGPVISRRHLLQYGAAVVALGLITGCRADEQAAQPTDHDRVHEAGVESASLSHAQKLADEYQTALNQDGVTRGVLLLAGTVRQAASSTEPAYEFHDPILLATSGDATPNPDDAGDFLDGCVIGLQGNDQAGMIVIQPIVYNSDIHSLNREQADVNVRRNIDLRAAFVAVDTPDEHLELIAFEAEGGPQIASQDGTPIQPGREVQAS